MSSQKILLKKIQIGLQQSEQGQVHTKAQVKKLFKGMQEAKLASEEKIKSRPAKSFLRDLK